MDVINGACEWRFKEVFSMYSKIVLFHVFISLFILVSIVYELRIVYT